MNQPNNHLDLIDLEKRYGETLAVRGINLSLPEKPVLGIISNLPLDTGAGGILAAMRGQSQPFLIYAELVE